MIVLRDGESTKRKYPGKIGAQGIGKGTLYFTSHRVCFESEKKDVCLEVYYDHLFNWTRKKRSLILRWYEPSEGRKEYQFDDPMYEAEVEIDKRKFGGGALSVWEVSKSLFYQYTRYFRTHGRERHMDECTISHRASGLYRDKYNNWWHLWLDTAKEQESPVQPGQAKTKEEAFVIDEDGNTLRTRLRHSVMIIPIFEKRMLAHCRKSAKPGETYVSEEFDRELDEMVSMVGGEITAPRDRLTNDKIEPEHGGLLEQDMIEHCLLFQALEKDLKINDLGIIREEEEVTREDMLREIERSKRQDVEYHKRFADELQKYESGGNTKELERIRPAHHRFQGGTIYDEIKYNKKNQVALDRTHSLIKEAVEKGIFQTDTQFHRCKSLITRELMRLLYEGKDISSVTPKIDPRSYAEIAAADAGQAKIHLVETV